MKKWKPNYQLSVFVILLALILASRNNGTVFSTSTEIVSQTQTSSPPGRITQTLILPTPTSTWFATKRPIQATHPTQVLDFTPTWIPSPMPKLIPTLDKEKSKDYLEKLLATNGGCTLPCFLGMTPGKTTWDNARNLFYYLGIEDPFTIIHSDYDLRSYSYLFSTKDPSVNVGVTFYIRENEIKLLAFDFQNWTKEVNIEKQYSPKAILSTLGVPAKINVGIMSSPYSSDIYPYILNYIYRIDDLWFIVDYEGVALPKDNDLLEFCPTDLRQGYQGNRIQDDPDFLVQQSDALYSTYDYVNLATGATPSSPSLMYSTGMDEATFYKKMMESNGKTCFTTPLSKWRH